MPGICGMLVRCIMFEIYLRQLSLGICQYLVLVNQVVFIFLEKDYVKIKLSNFGNRHFYYIVSKREGVTTTIVSFLRSGSCYRYKYLPWTLRQIIEIAAMYMPGE